MYEKKPWLKFYGNVPESIDYPRVTMYQALMDTAGKYPDTIAYDFLGYTSSYRRFAEEIDQCADALASLGLKKGDRVLVPARMQEVTVLGEVQSGTSHLWDPALVRNDYIRLSGGPTQKADEDRIYVVRANGSVVSGNGSAWFRSNGGEIRPGDSIVVPLDAERMRPLPLWTAVTTIIYNLAISVAAVNSF